MSHTPTSGTGESGPGESGTGVPPVREPHPAPATTPSTDEHLSLCEAIDRLLHKGVVLRGEIAISVADIELVYLSLQVLLASTDTARRFRDASRPALALSAGAAASLQPEVRP